MQSRMSKYHDGESVENEDVLSSRSTKNQELYKEVGNLEIENYDSNNNYSVIGTAKNEIDVDKIKDMLDKKYKEEPKNKSIGDATQLDLPEIKLDETREYDINAILKKAKEQKEVDYEEERKKKLRNTQYDILKNINIDGTTEEDEEEPKEVEEQEEEKTKEKEETLQELIDIASNNENDSEEETTELALDILSDLKGDEDDTKELGALELEIAKEEKILETKDIPKELFEETDEFTKTDLIEADEEPEEVEEDEDETTETEVVEEDIEDTADIELVEEETKTQELFEEVEKRKKDTSTILENTVTDEFTKTDIIDDETKTQELFDEAERRRKSNSTILENTVTETNTFSTTNMFTTDEFSDFADIKNKLTVGNILIKILVVIIIVTIVVGIVYLVNKYMNLGLF